MNMSCKSETIVIVDDEQEIAEVEGVDPSRVRDSIRRGLKQLAKYF